MSAGQPHPRELVALLREVDEVGVLPHDHPDSDALAAAAALRVLVRHQLDVDARICSLGTIGRAENRALAALVGISVRPLGSKMDLPESVILIDTQPGRRNNSLPPEHGALAVIDHHPDWGGNAGVPFLDLRTSYGATSTIVTSYLRELDVPIDAELATALFYAISSETRRLTRETSADDVAACEYLYPHVDKRLLGHIEMAPVSPEHYRLLYETFGSTVVSGRAAVALLDDVPYPDAVAEMADRLIGCDGVEWSICVAPYAGALHISVRSGVEDAHAGELLAHTLPAGYGGGHSMTAGGRIPLRERDPAELARGVACELLAELGCVATPEWLVPDALHRSGSARQLYGGLG